MTTARVVFMSRGDSYQPGSSVTAATATATATAMIVDAPATTPELTASVPTPPIPMSAMV